MRRDITFEEFNRITQEIVNRSHLADSRECILTTLVNAELNAELLTQPHRRFLDLAVVCMIPSPNDPQASVYAQVNREVMDGLGMSEMELLELADENTDALLRPCLKMGQVDLAQLGGEETGVANAVELTNQLSRNGASTGLKHWALEKAAEMLQTDELLVMPVNRDRMLGFAARDVSAGTLRDALLKNNRVLRGRKILSDHIYRYDRNSKRLSIGI